MAAIKAPSIRAQLVDENGDLIDASNPLEVNASVVATAQTVAKATAAAPTYVEGDTAAPLSVDLTGNLRTLASVSASVAQKATAADPSYVEASTTNPLSCDLAGYMRVLAKQSGIWSVKFDQTTPGTTNAVHATNFPAAVSVNSGVKDNGTIRVAIATDNPSNTNAWKVDGSAVTQPISAAALPLPAGASTSAKQPALGTAGTPSADVITVQGSGSGTALPVSGTFYQATQPVSLASVPSHAVTNAGTFAVQSTLQAGAAIIGQVGIDQTTPGTTNAVKATNLPTTVDTNSGNKSASTLRACLATDSIAIPLWGHGATGAAPPANAHYSGMRTLSASPTDTTGHMNAPVVDIKGCLTTAPYGLGDNSISGLTAAMTGTTSTAVTGVGAPGAGLYNYITSIVIGNSHATVGTFVELQDGNGGTTFWTLPAGITYGGVAISLPKPLKQPTANTALYAKNTTTGANVIVSVCGYKGP